jgi:hypothetical protein
VFDETESQLTCLKTIDETVASRDTESPKDDNKGSGAPRGQQGVVALALGTVVIAAGMLVM